MMKMMKQRLRGKFKIPLLCLTALLVLSGALGASYGWQSISQTAKNIVSGEPEFGDLTIEKRIENVDGSDVTEAQKDELFGFYVTFSDGGGYAYRVDGGEARLLIHGMLFLKHGETAVFEKLPAGITYTVEEVPKDLYYVLGTGHSGTITADGAYALFRNIYNFQPTGEDGHLRVLKVTDGYPEDPEKDYQFTLILDGVRQTFTLKADEFKDFVIPEGSRFEVLEQDYTAEGFTTTITNGIGTMQGGTTIECVVTNTKTIEETVEISGEKHWVLDGADASVLPEYILVRLKLDDIVIQERVVSKDADGRWLYTFDDVPKYDANGREIYYWIEEVPVPGFSVAYTDYDITNTYLPKPSVTLPEVEKRVMGADAPEKTFTFVLTGNDGAPMPEEADGQSLLVNITGNGSLPLGTLKFETEGIYTYMLSEASWDWEGWTFDETVYMLTYTVTAGEDGTLQVETAITKDGEAVTSEDWDGTHLVFENSYKSPEAEKKEETVLISGVKKWSHGSNLIKDWPEAVTIYIYADGSRIKTLTVTENEDWRYLVEVPRYAEDGHEIVYTIGEKPVPGYDTQIQGYNILNTYHVDEETTETERPEGGSTATTGDRQPLTKYLLAFMLSVFTLLQLTVLWISERKNRKNVS